MGEAGLLTSTMVSSTSEISVLEACRLLWTKPWASPSRLELRVRWCSSSSHSFSFSSSLNSDLDDLRVTSLGFLDFCTGGGSTDFPLLAGPLDVSEDVGECKSSLAAYIKGWTGLGTRPYLKKADKLKLLNFRTLQFLTSNAFVVFIPSRRCPEPLSYCVKIFYGAQNKSLNLL